MDGVKKVKDSGSGPALMIVGAIAAALLLAFSCGLFALLLVGNQEPGQEGNEPAANGSANASAQGGGNESPNISLNTSESQISAEDMSLWNSITVANVQGICLAKAKEEAEKEGVDRDMVFSCLCEGQATSTVKSYECDIRTADPFTRYFANIDCSLTALSCSVETNYGTQDVPFSELRSYYGG
jgi:hypothetical protein